MRIASEKLEEKRLYVLKRAVELCGSGRNPLQVKKLAEELNFRRIRTNDGKTYKGLRGTHQLIRAVVIWLRGTNRRNKDSEEEQIRKAFTPSPWAKPKKSS